MIGRIMRRAGRPWSFDSNSFATDNLLLVPNFSPVPPNMLTTSCWRARASSPMALNSPMLNGFDGISVTPHRTLLSCLQNFARPTRNQAD
jgi:hypothetical protein